MDSRTADSITPELSRTRSARSTLVKERWEQHSNPSKSGYSLAGDRAAAGLAGQPEPLKPTMRVRSKENISVQISQG